MSSARTRSETERSLAVILQQLRQRALWIGGTAGSLWGICCALLALFIGVWLDLVLQLSPQLRIGVLVSAIATGLIVFTRRTWITLGQSAGKWLACRLDDVTESGGQIVSGVELATAASPDYSYSSQPALTAGLAQLAIRRATRLAETVPSARAVPAVPVRRSLLALAGIVVASLLLAGFMPNLTATELRRFSDPFGDHPPFSTTIFIVSPGDTQVTYGAGLDIQATVDGPPLDELELVLRPVSDPNAEMGAQQAPPAEESVLMFAEGPGQWRASISNLTRPTTYFVRARNARSPRFTIDVVTVPRIEEVSVRVAPPEYTRLSAYEGAVPAAGISGLPGTQVTIAARSNRPLSGGKVAYFSRDNRREFPLTTTGESDLATGTFPIAGSGRIEVRLIDVAGQESTEDWTTAITELVDEQPFVRLVEPRSASFATPTAVIPVVISAEDDYGVSRLQLFRSLNDSRFLADALPVANPPPRHVYQTTRLPLEVYGLEPGDEIKLFARVEDNDPRAGGDAAAGTGKGAESAVAVIHIISHEQFEEMRQTREGMESLMAKYQQARRRLEGLAQEIDELKKELEELKDDEEAAEKTRKALTELSRRFEEEAESLRKLSEQKHPFAVDEALNPELQRLQKSLQRLQKQAEELANKEMTPDERKAALEQLAKDLREEREHLDQEAMQPLETLAAVGKMMQDESRFVELYRRQRDLANRLQPLRDKDKIDDAATKRRMRDLEEEQLRLRFDLDELLSDIEVDAAKLPEDESLDEMRKSAEEFVKALRESGATEQMQAAEQGLSEFSGTRGHAGAKEASDILEKFLSKSDQMGSGGAGGAGRRFNPGLSQAMQQTLQQMMQGNAQGNGSGGSSARRNNVGLYGNDPQPDPSSEGNAVGQSARTPRERRGRGGAGLGRDNEGSDEAHDADGTLRASGANAASAPLRYRRQVGRYFQRVADELGDK